MIFRNEAPVAGVGGVVAVITHHPVVVHFKGIGAGFLPVYQDSVASGFEFITFKNSDNPSVEVDVFRGQGYRCSCFGYPDRAKVVDVPWME